MFRLEEIFGRDPEDVRERNPKYTHAAIKKLGKDKRIVFLNSMSDTFHEKFSFELIKKMVRCIKRYASFLHISYKKIFKNVGIF